MQAEATSSLGTPTSSDSVTKLVPGASHALAHLSDSELLAKTRYLVGKSNQVFAALLVHLAEVEARGIYRTRSCSSLYTYCIYELRFSEDAASRRASAAKLVKRFPVLFDAIGSGELHLTGLLMLGPVLTPDNHLEVLARAKFRTKKEIAKLVRTLAPLPQVPDRIEPLGPEGSPGPGKPTWAEFVQSLCPPVRELRRGERPRDWANDTIEQDYTETETGTETGELSPSTGDMASAAERRSHAPARGDGAAQPGALPAPARVGALTQQDGLPAPAREATAARGEAPSEWPPLTGPLLYQMQFTTVEEHVKLVERAKALLSHQSPGKALGELHLQAMRMLVAALEKQRFAVGARPRKRTGARRPAGAEASRPPEATAAEQPAAAEPPSAEPPRREERREHGGGLPAEESGSIARPRQRGRYIPAAKRRAVFERDGGRCTYVDERGQRCRETHCLEIHHLKAFANGGEHELENLALRCKPHNTLAAEDDFGRDQIALKRASGRHESLRNATSREGPVT